MTQSYALKFVWLSAASTAAFAVSDSIGPDVWVRGQANLTEANRENRFYLQQTAFAIKALGIGKGGWIHPVATSLDRRSSST